MVFIRLRRAHLSSCPLPGWASIQNRAGSHCSHVEERHRGRRAAGRGGGDPLRHAKSACRRRPMAARLRDGAGRRRMRRRCRGVGRRGGRRACARAGGGRAGLGAGAQRVGARGRARPSTPRMSCCMRWTRPTSAPTRCDECSMRRARRRRGLPAPATVTGPDIPSSSRAGTGRICSRGFVATRARGHSWAAARTWSPSTAPTSHPVRTSTSADRGPERRSGEAAYRLRSDRRGVGMAVARAGVHRGGHRVECHLRQQLTGRRFTDRPGIAGVGCPARSCSE